MDKRLIIGVAIVLGGLYWAKTRFIDGPKEHVPTQAEQVAESVGRVARAKREGRAINPGDLKIISQSVPLDGSPIQVNVQGGAQQPGATTTISQEQLQAIVSAAAAMTSTSAPEVSAKARVQKMMELWRNSSDQNAFTMAAVEWKTGLAIAVDPKSYDDATAGFQSFMGEKSLPKDINAYDVQSAYHRSEGARSYTVVDVTINGAMYHMGVPEKVGEIFWTY